MEEKKTLDLIVTKNNENDAMKSDISNIKINDWLIQQLSFLVRNNLESIPSVEEKIKYLNEITNSKFILENKHIKINDFNLSDNLFDNITLPEIFNKGLFKRLKEELHSCESAFFISPFISNALEELLRDIYDFENLDKVNIYTTTYDKNKINLKFDVLEKITKLYGEKINLKVEDVSDNDNRLHAKIYYFKRKNSLSSLYVGSSNMSWRGLSSGNEFTIKISEFNNKAIFKEFLNYIKSLEMQKNMFDFNNVEKIAHIKIRQMAQMEYEKQNNLIIKEQNEKAFDDLKTDSGITSVSRLFDKENNDTYNLFDYQKKAINVLKERYLNNHSKHLVVMATGTGKTIVALEYVNEIAKRLDHKKPRVLFLAHRSEIIRQTKMKFMFMCGYNENDILELHSGKCDSGDFEEKSLVMASVQTLRNHKELFNNRRFDLFIMDEVHHVDGDDAKTFEDLFLYACDYSDEVLGLTATPERTNGNDVIKYFDGEEYAINLSLFNALENDYLAPFDYFMLFSDDLINFNIEKNSKELNNYLNTNSKIELIKNIINTSIGYNNPGATCLIFCSSISNAEFVSEELAKFGLKIKSLTSKISMDERINILDEFKNKSINYLCVVDIFNEGVDIVEINNVIFLRPTTSILVFTQQLGRGLRKSENKRLNVFDIVNNINVNKNKEYNPLLYLSKISNKQLNYSNEIINNPKIIDSYIPYSCNFWISKIDASKISSLLLKISKIAQSKNEIEKINNILKINNRNDYNVYADYLKNNFPDPKEFYFSKKCYSFTKDKDKILASILYLISIINIKEIISEFYNIVTINKKSNNEIVNLLFLKTYFSAQNMFKRGELNNDIAWKKIFQNENNYFKEIEFLCKYMLEYRPLSNQKIGNDILSFVGLNISKQQLSILMNENPLNELTRNTNVRGLSFLKKGDYIIIAAADSIGRSIFANEINVIEKRIKWFAPSSWRMNAKTSNQEKAKIEDGTNNIFLFFAVVNDKAKDDKKIFNFIGKVNDVKGPFKNGDETIYYYFGYSET